jgi:hypothetical protein
MRIFSICLALLLLAITAQQAHAWAETCADGNDDVCCHLERLEWDLTTFGDVFEVMSHALWATSSSPTRCDPSAQEAFDHAIPVMCAMDCWGGAVAHRGSWFDFPTQAQVAAALCTATHFVNGTCPAPVQPTPTPIPISSTASATDPTHVSSTASATESSSSSTGGHAPSHDHGIASSAALGPDDHHEQQALSAAAIRTDSTRISMALAMGISMAIASGLLH